MQITEQEIGRRLELLHFGEEEAALLASYRFLIEEEVEAIVEEFYRLQSADEEVFLLIGDPETFHRLHVTQRQYVLDLFSGSPDLDYVNNRFRVGLVHQRIGVSPRLYLAAVKNLKDLICKALERRIPNREDVVGINGALEKRMYFDMTLIFDAYTHTLVSEVQTEKDRVEVYAAGLEVVVAERTRELEEKVTQLQAALAAVKRLEGVIPICGVCKKIRDDKESWHQLEQYISEHSDALFSHGLCPDCYEKEMEGLRALKAARNAK